MNMFSDSVLSGLNCVSQVTPFFIKISGPRVMTLASNVPKATVSSGQSGTVLSMTPKSAQALQLAQASGIMTSAGSIPLTSASGKPNVIVVQKGASAFARGVTLPHGSKVLSVKF